MAALKSLSENWTECPDMPRAQTLKIMNMMDFIRNQIGVKYPQDDIGGSFSEAETVVNLNESADRIEAADSAEVSDGIETSEESAAEENTGAVE